MELGLRLLKERNRSKFDSYSVRNRVLIISHITFRDCQEHIFSDILSRNSCISDLKTVNPFVRAKTAENSANACCDCLALTALTRLGPLAEPTFCI